MDAMAMVDMLVPRTAIDLVLVVVVCILIVIFVRGTPLTFIVLVLLAAVLFIRSITMCLLALFVKLTPPTVHRSLVRRRARCIRG